MFEEKDYISRMIHGAIGLLARMLFQTDIDHEGFQFDDEDTQAYVQLLQLVDAGQVNEAENLLLERLDVKNVKDFQLALWFYDYLSRKDADFLEAHDLTKEEVAEGLKYVVDQYGYGYMNDTLLEDLE